MFRILSHRRWANAVCMSSVCRSPVRSKRANQWKRHRACAVEQAPRRGYIGGMKPVPSGPIICMQHPCELAPANAEEGEELIELGDAELLQGQVEHVRVRAGRLEHVGGLLLQKLTFSQRLGCMGRPVGNVLLVASVASY